MIHNGSHPITLARSDADRRVKPDLTAKRRSRPVVENDTYAAFSRRVIAAHARRVATGDIEALPDLTALYDDLDQAVLGLRSCGYSWNEIATRLGITRQAAHERWADSP
ncbi:MAG: hypothetical protein GEV09_05595 [Pseudonocardiaceae bacterium]|nr:hypothetical protein [Pseudonocardiaceae bacterium]